MKLRSPQKLVSGENYQRSLVDVIAYGNQVVEKGSLNSQRVIQRLNLKTQNLTERIPSQHQKEENKLPQLRLNISLQTSPKAAINIHQNSVEGYFPFQNQSLSEYQTKNVTAKMNDELKFNERPRPPIHNKSSVPPPSSIHV